jgi:hypothetical protein
LTGSESRNATPRNGQITGSAHCGAPPARVFTRHGLSEASIPRQRSAWLGTDNCRKFMSGRDQTRPSSVSRITVWAREARQASFGYPVAETSSQPMYCRMIERELRGPAGPKPFDADATRRARRTSASTMSSARRLPWVASRRAGPSKLQGRAAASPWP